MKNEKEAPAPDETQKQTMLFAQLVEILTQNAVMMLGVMPDRQGRQRPPDLNGAEMMIEMLAVLQKKTRGNLTKEEDRMLAGTLYQLQSAFADVASKTGDFGRARKATEAVEDGEAEAARAEQQAPGPSTNARKPSAPVPAAAPPSGPQDIQPSTAPSREGKVKFSKKYE